jgi:hypothetical protein
VMSPYEVSDVQPGESFLARDLLRVEEPVRVIERTATKTLVAWYVMLSDGGALSGAFSVEEHARLQVRPSKAPKPPKAHAEGASALGGLGALEKGRGRVRIF